MKNQISPFITQTSIPLISPIPVLSLRPGQKIYKRSFNKSPPPSRMRSLEWFSTIECYGSNETYGDVITTYVITTPPRLLDLGKNKVRQKLAQEIFEQTNNNRIFSLIDPDNQYSGGGANAELHTLIKKMYPTIDGTIIISEPVSMVDNEELEGATEIVIMRNHSKILKKM